MIRSRAAPILGALIAAGMTAYAASQDAQRPAASATPHAAEPVGWWQVLRRVWDEIGRDHVSMMAAAVAFYALLAIFPGISAAISLYGLVADPAAIERHLATLTGVLPAEALKLISDQVHALVTAPPGKLGLGLIVSLALSIWSATSATTVIMQTLTIAFEDEDRRGIVHFYLLAIGLTIGLIVFGSLALALVAGVPAALNLMPIPEGWREAVSAVRWVILALLVLAGLGVLYRIAPSRRAPKWEWFGPGTVAATIIWLLGSAGFSFYVARFGSYDKTYGSLGAVVVLLMWFYLTAYTILAGAELNAEVEKARTGRASTPPTRATVAESAAG